MARHAIGCLLFLFYVFSLSCGGVLTPEQKADIDRVMNSLIEEAQLPGMNLAVAKDDQIEHVMGYGVADIEKNTPMTPQTKFYIASTTKAFTATLAAKILSDKNISMDAYVKDLLGDKFHMPDAYATKHLTVRDLLCHRAEYNPDSNWPWTYYLIQSRDEFMMERLRHIPLVYKFRTKYVYSDTMYNLAGFTAAVVDGRTFDGYEDAVRKYIFHPLGMNNSKFIHEASENEKNTEFAIPYGWDNGEYRKVKWEAFRGDEAGPPCGAVATCAADMAKWLRMHTSRGRDADGNLVIAPEILDETYRPAITGGMGDSSLQKPNFPVTYTLDRYALGWNNGYYRGYPMLQHGGSWNYFNSMVSLIVPLGIGIYTSTSAAGNNNMWGAHQTSHMYIMDLLLKEVPWLNTTDAGDHLASLYPEDFDQYEEESPIYDETAFDFETPREPTRPLSEYAGVYGHFGMGNLTIIYNEAENRLEASYGPLGNFILTTQSEPDSFWMNNQEPYWFQGGARADFSSSDGSRIDRVAVGIDWGTYTWQRDLKFADAPPPPADVCP